MVVIYIYDFANAGNVNKRKANEWQRMIRTVKLEADTKLMRILSGKKFYSTTIQMVAIYPTKMNTTEYNIYVHK